MLRIRFFLIPKKNYIHTISHLDVDSCKIEKGKNEMQRELADNKWKHWDLVKGVVIFS